MNVRFGGVMILVLMLSGCRQNIIFKDDFRKPLDSSSWKIESKDQPESAVYSQGGKLIIDTKSGTTVWLNVRLSGNYEIKYDRTVILDSGKNDRLSDLNQFWMADVLSFERDGVFESYDSLRLYYVGFGGNYNTTTRFRKYKGNGEKPVLGEFTDSEHLLVPNHQYKVVTRVKNGKVSFFMDNRLIFEYQDPEPFETGYFGFRTTWSHHKIGKIRIKRI